MSKETGESLAKNSQYLFDASKFQPHIDEVKTKNYNLTDMFATSMRHNITQEDCNSFYPHTYSTINTVFPSVPLVLKTELFDKFDENTLMFIFFSQNDNHQRFLAGKELTKREWMFHMKYLTFFKILKLKSKNDDVIEGRFKFWDFENWKTGIKKEWAFELKQLEKFDK